jgi:hypothetical protein
VEGYPAAPGAPEIKPYGKQRFVLTLEGFRRYFAQDVATDESELLYCTQGPFAAAANNEAISRAAWRDKPSWFIMGEHDCMLTIDLEGDTAKRIGAKTLVPKSSHDPCTSKQYNQFQTAQKTRYPVFLLQIAIYNVPVTY